MEKEIYTRRICPIFHCKAGFDESTNAKCERCDGNGYLFEWVGLRELIKEAIK